MPAPATCTGWAPHDQKGGGVVLPEGIPTVTVRGRFLALDGKPRRGQVEFRVPDTVTFDAHDVILSGPVIATLDPQGVFSVQLPATDAPGMDHVVRDRKSTRLNSSHVKISYAVFCLKKKSN